MADDGKPEVGFFAVKRWFRLPWEVGRLERPARTLYLRPGRYSIVLDCYSGPVYLHFSPTYKVSVAANMVYLLGCRGNRYDENFYLEVLHSNYVSELTAGDMFESNRLLPASGSSTRR